MKKFFQKIAQWWAAHKPTKRRLIQLYAFLLTNANLKGFYSGNIYTGNSKYLCVPGLNCYSCPGAVGACPLGALQNALAASDTRAPYYVLGIIVLFGLILGRTICGFLCPFGFGQDLVYKIKTPKLKKSRFTRILSYLKYVILAVFVVALPLAYSTKLPVPAFCKFICPAGTLGGAIALLINPANEGYFTMLGPLFTWKFVVMVAIVVACIFIYRAFCRFICPLGALYGFFNKIALIGVKLDKNKCTDCGLCVSHCKMDIRKVGDHECINCGECISVCPAQAIRWKGSKLFIHENATAEVSAPSPDVKPLGALLNGSAQTVASQQAQPAETPFPAIQTGEAPVSSAETMVAKHKPKRDRNWWLQFAAWTLATIALISSLVYYNFIAQDAVAEHTEILQVGDDCYDFSFSAYCRGEGETVSISELTAEGKVVVLNFWFVGCGPCEAELPHFERFATEYQEDVTVIAVHSVRVTQDVAEWLSSKQYDDGTAWSEGNIVYAQDRQFSFEWTNDKGETKPIENSAYNLSGGNGAYPITIVIDRSGKVSYQRIGGTDYDTLARAVLPLLQD